MRMNKRAGLTAADIVNTYEEERLADIFYLYGELKNSRKLASVIVKARAAQKIGTIGISGHHQAPLRTGKRKRKKLAKVFQALRIEVNREMEALKEMLYAATEALKPGRTAGGNHLSFVGRPHGEKHHEDREHRGQSRKKTSFGNVQTPFRLVNNKVIVPTNDEIERNPRSRSAKLRIAEKIEE